MTRAAVREAPLELTAAALAAEADAAQTSVSAVIRDALARGLPLARDARRKRRSGPRHAGGAGKA